MDSRSVGLALAQLGAAVDELLGADLTRLDAVAVTDLVRQLEVQRRRLVGVDHRVLSEVDQRGVAGEYAKSSTMDLLVDMLRVAPGEAKARVAQARETQPTRMLCGDVVPAVLPRCADAVTAGEISAAHVTAIARTIDRIPADIAYEAAPVAEAMLVEAARHQHPVALSRTAGLLLARLDPDGTLPREDDLQRHRGFTVHRGGDGMRRVSGEWTPELAAIWDAILDALAAPQPSATGLADDRSAAQRRHDAMLEGGKRLLRSGTLPAAGGAPVTVLLRITPDDLNGSDGVAQTATGDLWPTRRVRANLGDAAIVPIIIDHDGAALMCGRTQRLATRVQRLALAARDGGCCFPQCTRPAAWCQAHHVLAWQNGGPTDITNLCLICEYHHREFERRGWQVQMIHGRPQWIPPPFIEPDRRPITNTAHHLPDIDFDLVIDEGKAG